MQYHEGELCISVGELVKGEYPIMSERGYRYLARRGDLEGGLWSLPRGAYRPSKPDGRA